MTSNNAEIVLSPIERLLVVFVSIFCLEIDSNVTLHRYISIHVQCTQIMRFMAIFQDITRCPLEPKNFIWLYFGWGQGQGQGDTLCCLHKVPGISLFGCIRQPSTSGDINPSDSLKEPRQLCREGSFQVFERYAVPIHENPSLNGTMNVFVGNKVFIPSQGTPCFENNLTFCYLLVKIPLLIHLGKRFS